MYSVRPFYATNDNGTGIDTGSVMYPMRPLYDNLPATMSGTTEGIGSTAGTTAAVAAAADSPIETNLMTRQELLISNLEKQIQRVDQILSEAGCVIQTSSAGQCARSASSPSGHAADTTDTINNSSSSSKNKNNKSSGGQKSRINPADSVVPNASQNAGGCSGGGGKLTIRWPDTIRYPIDIVVKTHRARMPVTPWAVRALLGREFVMIRTHVHSSDGGPLPAVENDNACASRTNAGKAKLIFTVIFRRDIRGDNDPNQDSSLQFMVDPVSQTEVSGEANLLRYVCRLLGLFDGLSVVDETRSDHLIDIICSGLLSKDRDRVQTTLKTLDAELAKNGLLVCDRLTPADFCLHAALERSGAVTSKSLSANVQKWQKRVAAVF